MTSTRRRGPAGALVGTALKISQRQPITSGTLITKTHRQVATFKINPSVSGPTVVEAQHSREVGPHEGAGLADHGHAQLILRDVAGHERRHPPQRRLLLREHGQLVPTRLEHALRLTQLVVDAPAVGGVPSDAVYDARSGIDRVHSSHRTAPSARTTRASNATTP
jgi:hypothetical protein